MAIDIPDRNSAEMPGGMNYKIIAEGAIPSIDNSNIHGIFEEHRIVHSIDQLDNFPDSIKDIPAGGLYGLRDNKFKFQETIVGLRSEARFKLINSSKLPTDIVISLKPLTPKEKSKIGDVFELDVSKTVLPPHGFSYVTVFFQPKTIQDYDCIIEASVEGQGNKTKPLTFQLTGAGSLPRVSLVHPRLKNENGQGVLNFRSLPVGNYQNLPISLRNDGDLLSQIKLPYGKTVKPRVTKRIDCIRIETAFLTLRRADRQSWRLGVFSGSHGSALAAIPKR